MSTKILISPRTAIAPSGAGVLSSLRVEFRPIFDGRELASPHGRFLARATSIYGPCVPGGSESYYEFAIEDGAGSRLQQFKLRVPRSNLINWRLEGSIRIGESITVRITLRRDGIASRWSVMSTGKTDTY